jgi:hypothetical protein
MRFPSIEVVAADLIAAKQRLDAEVTEMDVRLQVHENGAWAVRAGDASYDQDHRGFWGAGSLDRRTNCRELARDLLDQVRDDAAMAAG